MSRKSFHTDREILQRIFDMYRASYPGRPPGGGKAENDPYLQIDIHDVASRLDTSPELLYGRLYYVLDHTHSYAMDGGGQVHLFAKKVGDKFHCVHFPLLVAVLATQRQESWKYRLSLILSGLAALISIAGLFFKR
ncbi:hypothetical protein [Variovorax sp. PBL-E5]|uniref:hypothetical protein n=1 Tax=Variovorax sp. PBL-E5 TaxID=434014 RepID=UPI001318E251|nr:hypothetical protein [Variovorax sp. PBL-E5]VTU28484.1 hypothetical protein E5CHR_02618 [Variovorax sp. PBL-E5]